MYFYPNYAYPAPGLPMQYRNSQMAASPAMQQPGMTWNNTVSKARLDLNNLMRSLWAQHGEWTRMTINSLIQNLPDLAPTEQRLLRNPKDFAKVLRVFYGDSAASEFERLLTLHLTLAADLVKAAMAGDTKKAADIEKKWYENADDIAELLGSINPYWSVNAWKRMLHEHLRLVKQEAVDIIEKKYQKGISTYDTIEIQAQGMADMMTEGIARQFPQIFG